MGETREGELEDWKDWEFLTSLETGSEIQVSGTDRLNVFLYQTEGELVPRRI